MARPDLRPASDEQRETFLERLATGMSVVDATSRNESLRYKLYRLRKIDPDFAAEWATAWQEGNDALIHEALRRAVEGVDDVKVIGSGDMQREVPVKHYSDNLLMFLIRQRDHSFRDNHKVEVTGPNNGPVQVEHRGVKLSDILSAAREVGLTD